MTGTDERLDSAKLDAMEAGLTTGAFEVLSRDTALALIRELRDDRADTGAAMSIDREALIETIARVIRAYFGPGWLADGSENTSSMRCARAVAEALASCPASQSPVRVDGETDEVFEVVDRLNGRRAMEHVHPTAQAALNWLGALDEKYHRQYRVQSVPMFRASS